jgi:hypothetical protein
MSYLKDREIWLSSVPTGNPPVGYFWVFVQNGVLVVRDSNGVDKIMASTAGSITTAATASYVQYSNVANKPTLVSGSAQVSFTGITNKPTLVSGSAQITYSGVSGKPEGIVSSSVQVKGYNVFATTGSNQFNGSQAITGSLTVTGQVVAQTLNVQQVTSSIVYSSGSNIFGNNSGNKHQFTGSVSVTGSLAVAGNINLNVASSFPTVGLLNRASDSTLYLVSATTGFTLTDSSLNTMYNVTPTAHNWNISNSLKMKLDASGNLGLGVTPSAWNIGSPVIQMGTGVHFFGAGIQAQMGSNNFYNGTNYIYSSSNFASRYLQNNGNHIWENAPSGTSGNAITFTQAMTLTSGGNLYVGNTDFTSPNGADKFIGVYGGQDASLILQDAVQLWELYVNDDFYITSGATPRLTINRTTGAATFSSDDGSGNRTTVNNVLTVTQTNPNSPYSGFGSGILFRGTTYNGSGSGSPGVRNWGRIVMQLTDSSISTTGENMVFQVAPADNSDTLTTALTLAHNGAATFASSVAATSFIGGLSAPTYNNGTTFINVYDSMAINTSRAAVIYNSADSPTSGGMWSVQFVKWDSAYGSMTALNMEPNTQNFYVKTLYGGSWSSWVQK